jgi:sigma-B regulation protein RsbU (phosphoserine phosphatase)
MRNNGNLEEIDINGFPICSIIENFKHKSITVKLEKGDKVFFYTDGIIEAHNEKTQFFGFERIYKLLKTKNHLSGEDIISNIFREIKDFTSGHIKDDIAMVLVEII